MPAIQDYYYKIRTCLARMWAEIYIDGGSNLQDSKIFCENIVKDLLNITYDWNLINGNEETFNNGGFDLIDKEKQILIQVSSITTKEKVDNSIEKSDIDDYENYRLILFGLSLKPYSKLIEGSTYRAREYISFNEEHDKWTIKSLSEYIQSLSDQIEKVKRISDYLETQYGNVKKWQKPSIPKKPQNGLKLLDFIFDGEEYLDSDKEDNLENCEILFNQLKKIEIKHRCVFIELFEKGDFSPKEEKGLKINRSIVDEILNKYGVYDHYEFMKALSNQELCSDPEYFDDEDPAFYLYESNGFFIQNLKRYFMHNSLSLNELFCNLDFELLDA